jgi:hypothetical protein
VQNQTYPEASQTKASAVIQVISKTRSKPKQFLKFLALSRQQTFAATQQFLHSGLGAAVRCGCTRNQRKIE